MDSFVSIKAEPFIQDDNANSFLEIVIKSCQQLNPIATIKIQFQFKDAKIFQTDDQTCLLCGEICRSISGTHNKHITEHKESSFSCDLLDFQEFLKKSLKFYQADDLIKNNCRKDEVHLLSPEIANIFVESSCKIESNEVKEVTDVDLASRSRDKRHSCDVCGYKTRSKAALSVHFRTHTGEKPCCCDLCDFKTSHRTALKNHKRLIHSIDKDTPNQSNSQENVCNTCGYVAKNAIVLKSHSHVHQEDKQFSCNLCDFKSVRQISLINHKVLHDENQAAPTDSTNAKTTCNICGYVAKTKGKLKIHFRFHTGEKPFSCDLCDFRTSRQGSLRTHTTLIHGKTRTFSCESCDFITDSGKELNTHIRIHKIEQRFQCDICGLRLTTKESLESHFRLHTGEKPYKCDVCDYRCAAPSGMNAHRKIHSDHKPFLCDKCDYKTIRLQRLKIHMMVHTGEKSFKCSMCDYKCSEKNRIKRHMRIHTGEKPYSCEFCDYKSSIKGNLNTHIRGIHGKKDEIQCAKCDFTCLLKTKLREHMKFHAEANLNTERELLVSF